MCNGWLWCETRNLTNRVGEESSYFHYVPSSGACEELKTISKLGCVPAANCTFPSAKECYRVCGGEKKRVHTCADSEYGCCGDGVTARQGQGGCPGESFDLYPDSLFTFNAASQTRLCLAIQVVGMGASNGASSCLCSVV